MMLDNTLLEESFKSNDLYNLKYGKVASILFSTHYGQRNYLIPIKCIQLTYTRFYYLKLLQIYASFNINNVIIFYLLQFFESLICFFFCSYSQYLYSNKHYIMLERPMLMKHPQQKKNDKDNIKYHVLNVVKVKYIKRDIIGDTFYFLFSCIILFVMSSERPYHFPLQIVSVLL